MKKLIFFILFTMAACGSGKNMVRNPLSAPQPLEGKPAVIDTNSDPAYHYSYSHPKFVPPEGKILLIVGQEKRAIPEYLAEAGVVPGGLASYWGISSGDSITSDNIDNGVGVQNIDFLVKSYSNTAMQSAMWIVGMWQLCEKTTNGQFDKNIDHYIQWVKSVKVPVYLRIGYEFDGPHNALEPGLYVAVYRYIVDRMRKAGVNNAAYVWHSYAAPTYRNYPLESWYPGDEYVDWFGISDFGQGFADSQPNYWMDAVVDMAKERRKPVMICESAPIGGILPNSYETWNAWFVPVFSYIHKKNIKAFSYISENWDFYPTFAPLHWGDTRVQESQPVFRLWMEETAKPEYLKASAALFRDLGYQP